MVFPIVGGTQSTGDFVTNSLRLNDDDSPYLESGTLSSPNTDKFTISMWVKMCGARCQLAALGKRLTGETGDSYNLDIDQGATDSSGRLSISGYNGIADSNTAAYNSSSGNGPLIRDSSAWYHFVYAFDTGQASSGDRFKWYINGVLQSGYNTTTTPSQDVDLFPSSGSTFRIGRAFGTETRYADMYVAEYYYIDGQQYDHTYFGEFNDNGVWVPVEKGKGAGGAITFGTNGFYLQFKETGTSANASGIGADTSGNDNHLTPTNLAATDITTDTPQNNFATLNIINKYNSPVVAEGALEYDSNSSSGSSLVSTIAPSSGKWYVEVKALTSTIVIGVSEVGKEAFNVKGQGATRPTISLAYGGQIEIDGSVVDNEATFTTNDIIGLALNLDDGELTIYKNGTALNSGTAYNLHTNTTHENTGFSVQTATGSGNTKASFNFGNPAFAISSGNSDANGYGNFEYAVPSGYYALCTKNLAEYG